MELKQKLFAELDLYVNKEKFEKPRTIINVEHLVVYKTANEKQREQIKEILKNHRVSKGIYNKGYRLYFDVETMDIKTEDIHIVTIKVENKNNRPKAIATFNENISSFYVGSKCFKRTISYDSNNKAESIKPICLIMPADEMEKVFYHTEYTVDGDSSFKKMDYEMIRFDENSLQTYYSFGNISFVNFTPSIINRYWNGNDMDLTRHDVNLTSHANGWGLIFPVWSNKLIEVGYGSVYIDEDITKEEIDIIAKGHEDSWIIRDIRKKYASLNNNDEEDKAAKKEKMQNIKENIQSFINNHDEEIIDATIKRLGYDISDWPYISDKHYRLDAKRKFLASKEANFGMDCGFLYFRFKDETLNDLAKEVSAYGLQSFYSDGTFFMNIPYENQSTTVKSYQAQIIRDLIKKNNLPEISYRTVLD